MLSCTSVHGNTNDRVAHFGFDLAPGRYARDVMFAYRLRDGRIVERWAIRDDLAMITQLGILASNR